MWPCMLARLAHPWWPPAQAAGHPETGQCSLSAWASGGRRWGRTRLRGHGLGGRDAGTVNVHGRERRADSSPENHEPWQRTCTLQAMQRSAATATMDWAQSGSRTRAATAMSGTGCTHSPPAPGWPAMQAANWQTHCSQLSEDTCNQSSGASHAQNAQNAPKASWPAARPASREARRPRAGHTKMARRGPTTSDAPGADSGARTLANRA